jgi:uncharacterized protein with GYD domain
MIRLVTRGCFTHNYAKGLVSAPGDREPAVRKLIEGAGGKLLNLYFTTGDTDFMVISEANEAESIIAALPQFRQRRARQICLPRGGSAQVVRPRAQLSEAS